MLESLLAKQAISEQIYNYCRAMDRIDHELGYQIWHPDGLADYGDIYQGTGAGFIDFVCQAHIPMVAHSHQISNILIRLDGDKAASESYVTAVLHYRIDGQLMQQLTKGRYLDQWSCRNGRWAIDKRQYIHDLDDLRVVENQYNPVSTGSRDRSDPSYQLIPTPHSV